MNKTSDKINKKRSIKAVNNSRIILEIEQKVKSDLVSVANEKGKTLTTLLREILKNYLKKNSK